MDEVKVEKPGISCLDSLNFENDKNRSILVQGGFDFRVRILSTKTLKMLINL